MLYIMICSVELVCPAALHRMTKELDQVTSTNQVDIAALSGMTKLVDQAAHQRKSSTRLRKSLSSHYLNEACWSRFTWWVVSKPLQIQHRFFHPISLFHKVRSVQGEQRKNHFTPLCSSDDCKWHRDLSPQSNPIARYWSLYGNDFEKRFLVNGGYVIILSIHLLELKSNACRKGNTYVHSPLTKWLCSNHCYNNWLFQKRMGKCMCTYCNAMPEVKAVIACSQSN